MQTDGVEGTNTATQTSVFSNFPRHEQWTAIHRNTYFHYRRLNMSFVTFAGSKSNKIHVCALKLEINQVRHILIRGITHNGSLQKSGFLGGSKLCRCE